MLTMIVILLYAGLALVFVWALAWRWAVDIAVLRERRRHAADDADGIVGDGAWPAQWPRTQGPDDGANRRAS